MAGNYDGLHVNQIPQYQEYDANSAPQFRAADPPGLELKHRNDTFPSFSHRHANAVEIGGSPVLAARAGDVPKSSKQNRRRKWTVFGALLAVIVVIAVVVGSVLGVRGSSKSSSGSPPTSTNQPSSGTAPTSTAQPTPLAPTPLPPADSAYNGTSLATITYSTDGTPKNQNYVLFYQRANGEVRKLVYNQTTWYPSTLVTKNARHGTGLSTVWLESPIEIYLYYIDTDNYLQELRGFHASDEWSPGTLGQAQFKAANTYSHLDAIFVGSCNNSVSGWVNYEAAAGPVSQAVWNQETDSWTSGITFPGLESGADFVTELEPGVWRLYAVGDGFTLQEFVCNDCCAYPNNTYELSTIPSITTSSSALGGCNVGAPRLVYYQTSNNEIQEVNNTGNPGLESITISPNTVVQVMSGSRLAFAAGFRGDTQEPHLFYQDNSTSIAVTSRLVTNENWEPGYALQL